MMSDGPEHIIACDGGVSRCRVAIAQSGGAVLALAEGPAANPATSMSQAIACLQDTLADARRSAGLSAAQIKAAHAWFGLAGVINADIADEVARALPITAITVTDDRPTNMAGALGGADGFIAAIGTGSFLGHQNGTARQFVGGWGLRLGDQASGAWLGQRLLGHMLEWQDGLRDATPLLRQTFAHFGDDASAVVLFANDANPRAFADFAPRVVIAANSGDPAGLSLMQDGAAYIRQSLEILGFEPGDRLCFLGGLGPKYAKYLPAEFTANLTPPEGSALDGALTLAKGLSA